MQAANSASATCDIPPFRAPYAPADETLAAELLAAAPRDPQAEARIDARATRLVEAIRARSAGLGGVEDFLHAYALSTKEGLALMVLAEALLRVPDADTADALIEDKLRSGDWAHRDARSTAFLVSASAWTLGITARVIHPGETPHGIVDALVKRLGLPAVRAATRQAMRLLGSHFVLGQSIDEALARARAGPEYLYSFDMLGEGARTAADAERHFQAYAGAIEAIGRSAGNAALPRRPGISVKLSALHPRYEPLSRERVLKELTPRLIELARVAKSHELNFTVDAEEADRLELSLEVIAATLSDSSLAGWDGFGLAVQAYQKRSRAVIDWIAEVAQALATPADGAAGQGRLLGHRDQARAGARARRLSGVHPQGDDRSVLPRLPAQAAARAAAPLSAIRHPQRAHGGERDRGCGRRRRLRIPAPARHGRGALSRVAGEMPALTCRVYAPVGGYADLLAYLVRRLLENGANSSFVSVAADPSVPIADILKRPQSAIASPEHARHRHIPLPRDLFAPARVNSHGVEFGDGAALDALLGEILAADSTGDAAPLIDGVAAKGRRRDVKSPVDAGVIGSVQEADAAAVAAAMGAAQAGFAAWDAAGPTARADVLMRAGDLIEQNRGRLIALLQKEGGKTLDDCVSEVREASDFCRYYAAQALAALMPRALPGPTGESNTYRHRGRGVVVCISPWNFPLAIFTGQVAGALAAGNAVVAKPAEQTPLVAYEAVKLLQQAGVPAGALQFVPGDGAVGAMLVADKRVAGVAFTGSTQVGRLINRALAAKDGPIPPLIAETGGINAMIVDATALPEQVSDDVIASAFRSAGQRCSALRLLCLQDDVAERILAMVMGAARELQLGDPRDPATHVGPVIDAEAKDKLERWIAAMAAQGRLRFRWEGALPGRGTYVAPAIVELPGARALTEEVFGPVLHVVRWRARELDRLLDDIAANGTALTLGIHSRIDAVVERVVARLPHGNVYVNRNMIGAVVGSQPFGGSGLSGTGPKAGGPDYVRRLALDLVVTVNTAASGGNAALLAEDE